MKKLIAALIAAALTFSLCACGAYTGDERTTVPPESTDSSAVDAEPVIRDEEEDADKSVDKVQSPAPTEGKTDSKQDQQVNSGSGDSSGATFS